LTIDEMPMMPLDGWMDEGFATNESELCSKTKPTTVETTDVTTAHQNHDETIDATTTTAVTMTVVGKHNLVDTTTTEDITMTDEEAEVDTETVVETEADTETEVLDEILEEAEIWVDGRRSDEWKEQNLVLLPGI